MGEDEKWWQSLLKTVLPILLSALVGGAGGVVATTKLLKMTHAGYYIAQAGYEDFDPYPKTAWVPSTRSPGWQQAVHTVTLKPAVDCDHPVIQTAISGVDFRQTPMPGAKPGVHVSAVVDANTDGGGTTKFNFPLYVQTDGPNLGWVNVHWLALCPLKDD